MLARRIWATRPLAWTAIEVSETTFVWLEVLTTPATPKQADHAAPRTVVSARWLRMRPKTKAAGRNVPLRAARSVRVNGPSRTTVAA